MDPRELVDKVLKKLGAQVSCAEKVAILNTIEAGHAHGFGNLMAWLQTAWAQMLVEDGIDAEGAIDATKDRSPYPLP
jgi:hypothetical protein